MPTKKRFPERVGFPLRITREQRSRLEIMADQEWMSMTEFLMTMIDKEWERRIEQRRKKRAAP